MTENKSPANDLSRINRRWLLKGAGLMGVGALGLGLMNTEQPSAREVWLSAEGDGSDHYGLSWLRASPGQAPQYGQAPCGFRGHGNAVNPRAPEQVLMFARAPGQKVLAVDLRRGLVTGSFECRSDRHLSGHGCFSADGRELFVVEVDQLSGDGWVVVRRADNWQFIREFPSHGIGPHEIKLMPDQQTLVLANGGLLNRPGTEHEVVNLASMDSSLVYLDASSGSLISQHRVPEPKASIRHLDVADDGTLAIALQMQRTGANHNNIVALAAVQQPGQELALLAKPEAIIGQLNDYLGSVAINHRSRIAGFTSPRGNLAVFWHLDSQQFIGYHQLRDVCGLAVTGDQQHFILSSSLGQVRLLNAHTLVENKNQRLITQGYRWDNHLAVTSA